MIGAVGQQRFVNAAVVYEICLAVAYEIRRAGKHRAFHRRLEKSGRPWEVVRIDRIFKSIVLRRSELNGIEHSGRGVGPEHQMTVSVSPMQIFPPCTTDA